MTVALVTGAASGIGAAGHEVMLATADDVAQAVAWMVSPAAATITGIALPMDGGRSA